MMAVKGGAYVWRALMSDDCTEWIIGLQISTFANNGDPRIETDVELRVPVANSENQTRTAIISRTKEFITSRWGFTFQPADTVQVYGSSLFVG